MKGPALLLVALLAGCTMPAPTTQEPEAAPAPLAGGPLAWTERADAPMILAEAAVAQDEEGRVFVVGGWTDAGGGSPFALRYDASEDAWTQLPPYPLAVHHAQAAVVEGTLYVFGGALTTAPLPGSVVGVGPRGWPLTPLAFRLPEGAASWEPIAQLPAPRGLGGAAVVDGVVHLVGGVTLGGEYAEDVLAYDPASDGYAVAAALPTLRDHLNVLTKDGEIWAVAGRHLADGWDDLGTVEVLDVATGGWRALPDAPHGRGGQAAGFLADGRLALYGGENAEGEFAVYDEGYALDPATGAWEPLPPMPQTLHGMVAATWDGKLLVIGGSTETTIQTSTLMLAPQEA